MKERLFAVLNFGVMVIVWGAALWFAIEGDMELSLLNVIIALLIGQGTNSKIMKNQIGNSPVNVGYANKTDNESARRQLEEDVLRLKDFVSSVVGIDADKLLLCYQIEGYDSAFDLLSIYLRPEIQQLMNELDMEKLQKLPEETLNEFFSGLDGQYPNNVLLANIFAKDLFTDSPEKSVERHRADFLGQGKG